jgi:hypothetical protein
MQCNFMLLLESYGFEPIKRRYYDKLWQGVILMADKGIGMNGIIKKWSVYLQIKSSSTLTLQVWRQQSFSDIFQLVGQVTKKFTRAGPQYLSGAEAGNIKVKRGDILGFQYAGNSPIYFDGGKCGLVPQIYMKKAGVFKVGYRTKIPKLTSSSPCRKYSIQVEIASTGK